MGDTMREKFERWGATQGCKYGVKRWSDTGLYIDGEMQAFWKAWQAAFEAGRQLGMEQAHALHELAKSSREIEAKPVFWVASWALDDLDKVYAYGNDVPIRIWRNPSDKTGLSPLYITPPAGDSDTQS